MKILQFKTKMFETAIYNEKTSTLTLIFTGGPCHEYSNFSAADLEEFLNAKSKITYFVNHIKGKFPCKRVGLV